MLIRSEQTDSSSVPSQNRCKTTDLECHQANIMINSNNHQHKLVINNRFKEKTIEVISIHGTLYTSIIWSNEYEHKTIIKLYAIVNLNMKRNKRSLILTRLHLDSTSDGVLATIDKAWSPLCNSSCNKL